MAIFGITNTTITLSRNIVEEADKLANNVLTILATIDTVVDDGPKVLRRLRNLINTLLSTSENAQLALRNNPIARGPWKILIFLLIGLLRGIDVVLRGLKAAVSALLNFLRSTAIKQLKKKNEDLQDKLFEYFALSTKVINSANYLIDLCDFLEEQQKPLEAAFPGLRPGIEGGQLRSINGMLKSLLTQLQTINTTLDTIIAKRDTITGLLNSVNAIVNAATSVTNAINSVLGLFNRIFSQINDWLSKIPFIGWLLDQLNSLINKALDVLGINALLKRVGASVRNLPFIKAVFDFLDNLKNSVLDLIQALQNMLNNFVQTIMLNQVIKALTENIIFIFSQLDLEKLVNEFLIPEWLVEIIEKAGDTTALMDSFREANEEEKPNMEAKVIAAYQAMAEDVASMTKVILSAPNLPFKKELQVSIQAEIARFGAISTIDLPVDRESLEIWQSQKLTIEIIEENTNHMLSHISKLQGLYIQLLRDSPEFPENYFENELHRIWRSQEDEQSYLRLPFGPDDLPTRIRAALP